MLMTKSFLGLLGLPEDRDPIREELIACFKAHYVTPCWNNASGFYLKWKQESGSWVKWNTKRKWQTILKVYSKKDVDLLKKEVLGR
jgi:hypothetical protein